MGIGTWVRGLFGRAGETVPCNLCRCDIPFSDFERGVAVIIARQKYCRGCVEEITRRAKDRPIAGWTLSGLEPGSSSTIYLR